MSEAITRAHVLSNGEYGVLVTPSGNGFSALRGYAVTSWTPDPVGHAGGIACYIRDLATNAYFTVAQLPCPRQHAAGRSRTCGSSVEQSVTHHSIEARCEIFVSARSNAEVRRVSIRNNGETARFLEFTSFSELALDTPAGYAAHPAFAKLFVQTAYDADRKALIAWRRKRSPDDTPLWVAQRLVAPAGVMEFETDRARFLGRTRSPAEPETMCSKLPLSGSTGTVLDPAFCLRTSFELAPHANTQLELVTFAASSREELEQILDSPVVAERSSAQLAEALNALGLPERWREAIRFESFDHHWEGSAPQSERPVPTHAAYGGFSENGSEYVLSVGPTHKPTPQPWTNVIANEQFGCLVSETGAAYTWAANSRENRITPWSNDPVADVPNEALYVRDRESGKFWSVFPGPTPADASYVVRHGFGYSRFSSLIDDLAHDAHVFVPRGDAVRIVRLTLTNHGRRARRLSAVSYAQLVLGTAAADTRTSVETSYDRATGVVFAINPQRAEFAQRVAFAAIVSNAHNPLRSASGSRAAFIGANGSIASPAALQLGTLDGRFGRDLDPCAALQLDFEIDAGETVEFAFLLGEAADHSAARQCLEHYASLGASDDAFSEVSTFWRDLVGRVQARTPVRAFDLMLNGWLSYQNLACRMWGRSAFYQSGGAFGFRDQLQDSSALLYLDPQITRNQILLHASHQFIEGDVLHWWHPPASKGIRTRFSDDLLWLPYITAFYISATGDRALLDETAPYLTSQQLCPEDDEIFVWPQPSGEDGTVYEHCCKAIDRSLTRGEHGLPLMGVGDWNDGMNRVGRDGRGESVWLGFFLFDILHDFIPLCEQYGDSERGQRYTAYLDDLAVALNDAGWDGQWYRRAYYDNGAPLGSQQSDEGKIDTLAQAWAVLSRAAPEERAHRAIASLKQHLVSEQDGIIRLLTPAFDRTPHDPGYIKGYVPGVRENGGQYTHAAIWAVRALAEMNDRENAAKLAEMLTPVSHTRTPEQVERYKGEPYVVAADVYGVSPHVGRAGWTWYTGSAGWLYRLLLESILGFSIENGDTITLCPCIPSDWPGFTLSYRFPSGTLYTFDVVQQEQPTVASVGKVDDGTVVLVVEDDGAEHHVTIKLGHDVGPAYRARHQEITAP